MAVGAEQSAAVQRSPAGLRPRWQRRRTQAASIVAGASSGTVPGSGNARALNSRIARVCRSTASAMPGSTRRTGVTAW